MLTFENFLFCNPAANVRLREVIDDSLDEYQSARSKMERTAIVSQIIASVQDGTGKFVRQDVHTKRWFHVSSRTTREKVGQAIRAAIRKRRGQYNTRPSRTCNQNASNAFEQVGEYSGSPRAPITIAKAGAGREESPPNFLSSYSTLDSRGSVYSPSDCHWIDMTPSLLDASSFCPRPRATLEVPTPGFYPGGSYPGGSYPDDVQELPTSTYAEGISHERQWLQGHFGGARGDRLRYPCYQVPTEFDLCEPIALNQYLQPSASSLPRIDPTHAREILDASARARNNDISRKPSRSLGVAEGPIHHQKESSPHDDPVGLFSRSNPYGHTATNIEYDRSITHIPPEDRPPVGVGSHLLPDAPRHAGTPIATECQGTYLKDQSAAARLTSKRGRKK